MGENYCKTPCPGTVMYRHSQIPFLSVRVHRGRLRVLRQQRLRPRLPGRPRPLRRPRQGGRHLRVDRHRQLSLGLRVGPGKAHRRRHGHELHDTRSPLQLGSGLSLPKQHSSSLTCDFLGVEKGGHGLEQDGLRIGGSPRDGLPLLREQSRGELVKLPQSDPARAHDFSRTPFFYSTLFQIRVGQTNAGSVTKVKKKPCLNFKQCHCQFCPSFSLGTKCVPTGSATPRDTAR